MLTGIIKKMINKEKRNKNDMNNTNIQRNKMMMNNNKMKNIIIQ